MIKKFTLLSVLMCFVGINSAFAQYNKVTCNFSNALKIVQIDQFEDKNVMYLTYTSTGNKEIFVDMGSKVQMSSNGDTYKLKNVENVATNQGDDVYSILNNGQKLNVVLTFEKFPLDKSFDITVRTDDEKAQWIKLTDISVDTASQVSNIDHNRFIAAATAPQVGYYREEGALFSCMIKRGLNVAFTSFYNDVIYDKQRICLSITNETGKPVDFKFSGLSAIYNLKKDKGTKEGDIQTCEEWIKKMKSSQGWMTALTIAAAASAVASAASGEKVRTSSFSTAERKHVVSVATIQQGDLSDKEFRQQQEEYYTKDRRIENGDKYVSFFNVKDVWKGEALTLRLNINGDDFEMNVPIYHNNKKQAAANEGSSSKNK